MSRTVHRYRRIADAVTQNRVFRSVFRHSFADTNRNRSLAVFSNLFLHIHPVKVNVRAIQFTRTFYLGGLSAATFFILVVTGIFLMFVYHPSVPRAYEDMKDLQFVVYMGPFLRNLHRWAAHAMVALVLLHMVRVFFAGAYRPPREFNWVIGVMLLLITILLSYTGYLLPWDQLAYWGVTVGTNMADSVPYFGHYIKFLLLGGTEVNENALLRFYVLHCVVLPFFLVLLLSVHIWRVRKDGGIYLGEPGGERQEEQPAMPEPEPAGAVLSSANPDASGRGAL
ncbi:MAG TPA: cytochrome b N-terminal domain-containing protein [Terriglobales bacterium]|nr:cytochrome b N-terminal domain-containing protein [Terriglobales bacterium]